MSTANEVPVTAGRSDDDAGKTLAATGRMRLVSDAFKRMRAADGFSHARSLAFLTGLLMVQGVITLVGLASALGKGGISDVIVNSLQTAAPGPAGKILTEAVSQAHRAGATNRSTALFIGLAAAVLTGTLFMAQLERGMNRLYGMEQDRSTLARYGHAFLLAISAGTLATFAFVAVALGRTATFGSDTAGSIWGVVRWPLGLILMAVAIAMLFRWSPNRRQPSWSWLAFGAIVAVVLWTIASVLLGWYFSASGTFGQTYGPLAGIVAMLLWSVASCMALLFGASIAAQLEAVRAGVPAPRDPAKATSPPAVGDGRLVEIPNPVTANR